MCEDGARTRRGSQPRPPPPGPAFHSPLSEERRRRLHARSGRATGRVVTIRRSVRPVVAARCRSQWVAVHVGLRSLNGSPPPKSEDGTSNAWRGRATGRVVTFRRSVRPVVAAYRGCSRSPTTRDQEDSVDSRRRRAKLGVPRLERRGDGPRRHHQTLGPVRRGGLLSSAAGRRFEELRRPRGSPHPKSEAGLQRPGSDGATDRDVTIRRSVRSVAAACYH